MPLDDVGEVAFRFIGRVIGRIILEIFFEILCYYIGRSFLFIISFGNYKPKSIMNGDGTFESVIGMLLVFVSIGIYIII